MKLNKESVNMNRAIVQNIVAFLIAFFSYVNYCGAKTIRVAVVDTGYSKIQLLTPAKLCDGGHQDFTMDGDAFKDTHGHGTHIAGVISSWLKDKDYCLVILKFYSTSLMSKFDNNATNAARAIRKAVELRVDVINLSMGGLDSISDEKEEVSKALDRGIIVVAAAGNEGLDLRRNPYFPACYDDRIHMVGSLDTLDKRLVTSNYVGNDRLLPDETDKCNNSNLSYEVGTIRIHITGNMDMFMMGTSQATAMHTGKTVLRLLLDQRKTLYIDQRYFDKWSTRND